MKRVFLAFASLLTVGFVSAQTVDEIIAKHIDALGGKENLEKVQNVIMDGTLNVNGAQVNVVVTQVHNKLFRQDISVAGMKGYDFVTDKEGWTFMPFQGMQKAEPKTPEEVKESLSSLDLTGSLYNYAAKGNKVELLGKEDVEGTECFKLKVTLASGKEETYFIDPSSYLLIRSITKMKLNGKEIESITDFSDYKTIDGVKMPYSITQPFGVVVFSSIKINQTIDPKLFTKDGK